MLDIEQVGEIKIINTDDELIQITYGEHENSWVRERDTVELINNLITLNNDEVHKIYGNYYHDSQFDEYDIVFDECQREYTFSSECVHGYIDSHCNTGHFSGDWVSCGNDYYINERIAGYYGVYFCDSCDNYCDGCDCAEQDDNNEYCFNYHSGNNVDLSSNCIFKIGFEVEKEDTNLKIREDAHELFKRTSWAKECDGSLSDESGFELVSPILPLDLDAPIYQQKLINESINAVKDYINADYEECCGGHINISEVGKTSNQLLQNISGYLPLFYALYNGRIANSYCKAKSKTEYLNNLLKYSAFHCKQNNVLEIRIFPAVKNITNLLWRSELLRIILANQTTSYRQAVIHLTNQNHELHQHLLKIYTSTQLLQKLKLFIKYAKQFDDIYLSNKLINRGTVKLIKSQQKAS